jgi:hypothetical protein
MHSCIAYSSTQGVYFFESDSSITPWNPCAAQEIGGQNNFFWSASTESVLDVTSQDFKNDFFKAYDGFEKIFGLVGDCACTTIV